MGAGLTLPRDGRDRHRFQKVMRPYTNLGLGFQRGRLAEWRTVLDNVLLQVDHRRLDATQFAEGHDLLARAGLSRLR